MLNMIYDQHKHRAGKPTNLLSYLWGILLFNSSEIE